ncbi:aldehyde ferredoxin oxidoreductase family protein [Desulfallas sp. Bu1-1]|uniref:aldehyde ferredoxin oxidoreductase family protein n=1 Tax=Desulfallas sp. Bu1-1 TaxID=2787620 RepID=UPI00189E33D3|nr:aldehyde ferredoxin oxidoreductase family protein [Desulfallas sp. Bu1-1]MBF7081536.1 aldehyde ferredoxin oxidoreductase family protein [Desulfallas sp. Bu1-1]
MGGYQGLVLRVDLTNQKVTTERLNMEWAADYLGGKGLGMKYLYEEVGPGAGALAPENKLIFMTGPFTGTIVPCSGKLSIVTKSPASGTILDCSIGGSAAVEIKRAGYDAVIIEGKSDHPVYLLIEDDRVELREAKDYWGLGCHDTEEKFKQTYGDDYSVLSTGPAGENLVTFACITSDMYRQAGRGGVGAVMGSKMLKAVVVKGTGGVGAADIQKLMEVAHNAFKNDLLTDTNLWAYTDGTPMIVELSQTTGILPTNNFQQGNFDKFAGIKSESVTAARLAKKGCTSCGLGCGNFIKAGDVVVEGPEYETLSVAGSNCGIGDLGAIAKFNNYCDAYGLDSISTGGVIAFAMEMTEKGIHDFGIRFGDVEKYLELPGLIATRRGLGAELANGVKKLAETYGGREFAMQVKGLEFPGYDPRGSWGMGLAYATAPRGACHMSAWPVAEEAYGERDPFTIEGKAELVKDLQHYNAAKFSLILCDFWALSFDLMAEMLAALLGREITAGDLELAGERIFNLARLFNIREGMGAKDDVLPERIYSHPLPGGATMGKTLPEGEFKKMLAEYYSLRGWDENGRPTPEKLARLGLA